MATINSPPSPVVLVVEDEPLLRLNAVDLLEEAGFSVIDANNADEAIALLAARSDIRIVITDIDMPGSMDGLKLAAAIRNRWPPIEIIITSGKTTPAQTDLPVRGLFFSKPYNHNTLIDAVKSFLNN